MAEHRTIVYGTVTVATPAASRASAETVAARRSICEGCPHWRPGWLCGVLADWGKGADIMGSRGVPAASAKCPDGRWGPQI